MSNISVNVTNAGSTNVSVSNGSTVNATVGNGGVVNVALGTISPGNATVVSGTLTINSTTTLAAGSSAYAKNVGTVYAASLDIGIPAGPATLVSVGNTTTLASGSNATVTSNLSGSNLTLAFGIPQGANGINGVTPSFAIGNVVTSAAGSSASVKATATNGGANVTLDLTIPRGDPGTSGSDGTNGTSITLSDGTPANLGIAAPGSSSLAARIDHIHNLPVIGYANLSGVPSNFPTNTTLVAGLNSSYSGIAHGHNYVTALNNLTGSLTLAAGSNVTLTANGSTLTLSSVGGLGANDSVDGGDYVGETLFGITFGTQPQSQTLNVASYSATIYTLPSGTWGAVSYANGSWIATPDDSVSGDYIATSTTGTSWTKRIAALPFVGNWSPVVYGSGVYVTTRIGTSNFATSSDGISWTSRTTPFANASDRKIIWTGTRFLSSGGFFTIGGTPPGSSVHQPLYTSSDGVTWTARIPETSLGFGGYYFEHVAVADGKVFLFGRGETNQTVRRVFVSSDGGETWSRSSSAFTFATSDFVRSLASNGGTLTAFIGNAALTSTDGGVTWTSDTANRYVRSAVFAFSRYVAITEQGLASSNDGYNWVVRQSLGGAFDDTSLSVTAGGLVATSWSVPSYAFKVFTSTDGLSWNERVSEYRAAPPAVVAATDAVSLRLGNDGTLYRFGAATASASLTVSASVSGGAAVSYQWQSSTDAGSTWANVTNATTSTLSLTGLTTANSGTRYRAAASATGATTAFSQSATLTVSG
jgi:hypothetical protein